MPLGVALKKAKNKKYNKKIKNIIKVKLKIRLSENIDNVGTGKNLLKKKKICKSELLLDPWAPELKLC